MPCAYGFDVLVLNKCGAPIGYAIERTGGWSAHDLAYHRLEGPFHTMDQASNWLRDTEERILSKAKP